MKLVRFGALGTEQPGLIDDQGILRDLSSIIDDVNGKSITPEALDKLRGLDVSELQEMPSDVRLGPCVADVGKIICIGLNFSDHAAESGMEVPEEPVIFFKATSSISGPNDDVLIPRGSEKSDWEVELGVVIGKEAKYVSEEDAIAHVAGFCVINDLSERAFQLETSGQWVKGKSCDTFCPLGPWLVTRDEIEDYNNLKMTLDVNDHRYQNGSTSTMIFKVPFIVSYLSQFMSLQPGVGLGQTPPVYLKAGDVMRLSIEGLGEQTQKTRPA